jgi:hypothetical protein
VNGRHLVSAEGSERLAAMAVSPDGRFLLTAGAKGMVVLRWLHSLQVHWTDGHRQMGVQVQRTDGHRNIGVHMAGDG